MYEQLVETYLTVFERLAVVPQFPVLFDDKDEPWTEGHKVAWAAYPDFLAVQLKDHEAQIIEVSKSRSKAKARELVQRLLGNREKIERYVKWFTSGDFEIKWRFFVRDGVVLDTLESELKAKGIQATVTALEVVFEKLKRVMP